MVSRSASFSIAVLSSSTTSTNATAQISSTARIAVAPTNHASGSDKRSATISSRTACSERNAKARPLRELIVAFQIRSKVLEPRCGGHRPDLAGAFLLEQFCDQESHVDGLLGVEPGITDRVIAVVEILVGDRAGAAEALGDVLAGHLQMHAAGMGAFRGVDREERLHLRQDAVEGPRLVTRGRGDGVAVHGIARPDHHFALALHGADHVRQVLADLVGTEAAD